VQVGLPGLHHALLGHQLIQCEACATRLDEWSGEVGGQCEACATRLDEWSGEVGGQSEHALQDWMNGPGRLGVSQPKSFVYMLPLTFGCYAVTLTLIHWLRPPLFLP